MTCGKGLLASEVLDFGLEDKVALGVQLEYGTSLYLFYNTATESPLIDTLVGC